MKEAKKARQQLEQRRLKELEKGTKMEKLADEFYKRYLFRRYALGPLRSLVQQSLEWMNCAQQHYGYSLMLKVFEAWKSDWIDQQNAKLHLARKMYRHNLMWYAFDSWKALAMDTKLKFRMAAAFHGSKIKAKYFFIWRDDYMQVKKVDVKNENKAMIFYEKRIKSVYFDLWRRYVCIADDIKKREQRREEWRDLVKKFIPSTAKG